MRFFATITACLALAVGSVFARLPLPEGWRITEVFAIGANQLDDAFGNPNNPLLNATLTCKKKKHPLWWTYHLHGTGWHGVTEKKLKQAAAHGNACMTKWKFHSYTDTECFTNADGSKECTDNVPMWNASFRHSLVIGSTDVMMWQYEKLTGCFGKELEVPRWRMTNGTDTRMGSTYETYPPYGHMFAHICE